jgi:putative ABC transport system substrate-binding protein
MQRRKFILLIGGAAAAGAWPLATQAQQAQQTRRIAVLMSLAFDDPVAQLEVAALQKELQKLGLQDGHNIKIEYRWAGGDLDRMRTLAREIVDLQCDIIITRATPATKAVVRATSTIPVVFVQVSDPIGDGFIANMARPGGNVTGFTNIESSMVGKWLEILKEIVPALARVAFIYNPPTSPAGGSYFLRPFETIGPLSGLQPIALAIDNVAQIEDAIREAARLPRTGLIVSPGTFVLAHRDLVIGSVAYYRLPTIYPFSFWPHRGGLISYGTDSPELFRQAASYVDRILKGAKPADLPVQAPTKFEPVINLKTAKALGLNMPTTLLDRADEVIE